MTGPAQLVFDLPVATTFGAEDFHIAPSNRTARAWVARWREWPAGTLALFGPTGCGKTHLARIFAAESGARGLGTSDVVAQTAADATGDAPAIVVDDADSLQMGNPDAERALLHLINWCRERSTPLLLTGTTPPSRWPVTLPDLRSRLCAMTAVGIEAPDDALISAVMLKLFSDRGVLVDADVPDFLIARIDRSLASVRDAVARADAASLGAKKRISVRLLRPLFGSNAPTP